MARARGRNAKTTTGRTNKVKKGPRSGQKTAAKRSSTRSGSAASSQADEAKQQSLLEEEIKSSIADGLLPADGKLYYRIGEVSRITGVKPYVLRYWESEFRWMAPQKSRSKQRLYRRRDIEMILLIRRLLHDERYTIAGARKRLRELGVGRALEEAAEGVRAEATSKDVPSTRQMCQNIRRELVAIRGIL